MTQLDRYLSSAQEVESRFQELRAQQDRAKQLFYCYASDDYDGERYEEAVDAYLPYYGDR